MCIRDRKICKQTGVAAVECRTTHKHGVEPTLTAAQRADVKKQFADAGVVFWGCGSVCEFHSDKPEVVQKNIEDCKQFAKLVHDLGGTGVKVRPNGVPKGADEQKTFEQIGKALQECGKAAEGFGVEIWVEVHGAVTQIPKNMKTIMDACGHKAVGVTWNSNPTDVANGSVAAAFDLLKPWIKSCHINELGNDTSGKYPYRELFKLLRGIGYDRYTLCEVGTAYDPEKGAAYFKADLAGSYVASLTVTDGQLNNTKSLTITASGATSIITNSCCKVCTTGKACGSSCISRTFTCRVGGGCAC